MPLRRKKKNKENNNEGASHTRDYHIIGMIKINYASVAGHAYFKQV